jgi:hypothetical protein
VLLTLDEPVPYVMEQLGHTDPKVTLGIYARVMRRSEGDRERLRALVDGGAIEPAPVAPALGRVVSRTGWRPALGPPRFLRLSGLARRRGLIAGQAPLGDVLADSLQVLHRGDFALQKPQI